VILVTFILALFLLYVELRMTSYNMNVVWNGYGSIAPVLKNESMAPMQYRVLVPWLYKYLPVFNGKYRYILIKGLGIWFALLSFAFYCKSFGYTWWHGVLFLTAILPVFFLFDYADCFFEFGFLASACAISTQSQQHLVWLVPLTLLAALNRETGVFIPILYYVLTGGIVGALFLMGVFLTGYAIPRIYYGKKKRYCSAVMLKRNLDDLRFGFRYEHVLFFLLLAWYVGLAIFVGADITYLVVGLFMLVLAVPSVWIEIRVFMPVLLVTIPATLSIL